MTLPADLSEFLAALNRARVRYLIVGGYATIFHGYARSTQAFDIWVERTAVNHSRLMKAFPLFGLPLQVLDAETFLRDENVDVFTFGRPPSCIDIMNRVKGLRFQAAWKNSVKATLDEIPTRILSSEDLRTAKAEAGRHRDLDDLEHL